MNKLFLITIVISLALIGYAFACECSDTDQQRPPLQFENNTYGPFGDNGVFGGTTAGFMTNEQVTFNFYNGVPQGCTMDTDFWHSYTCNDTCIGTTFREFYCGVKPESTFDNLVMWHDYENSDQCRQVPEFPVFGTIIAGTTVLALVLFVSKRH